MPKMNIDIMCEPIEITVGGKEYIVVDIPPETADKMAKVDEKGGEENSKRTAEILVEILGAQMPDIVKLGMRKRTMLIIKLMDFINKELEAKNVLEAEVKKPPK